MKIELFLVMNVYLIDCLVWRSVDDDDLWSLFVVICLEEFGIDSENWV